MSYSFTSRWPAMIKELDVNVLTDADFVSQLLRRVKENGDQYILKENDKAEAVLIPLRDLENLQRRQELRQHAWDDLFANMHEVHTLNANFSPEEVEADVDAAIRETRQGQ